MKIRDYALTQFEKFENQLACGKIISYKMLDVWEENDNYNIKVAVNVPIHNIAEYAKQLETDYYFPGSYTEEYEYCNIVIESMFNKKVGNLIQKMQNSIAANLNQFENCTINPNIKEQIAQALRFTVEKFIPKPYSVTCQLEDDDTVTVNIEG